jgi:hypothetical protein
MPLLALNRKDTGGESIGRYRLQGADFAGTHPETLSVWRYRGRAARVLFRRLF